MSLSVYNYANPNAQPDGSHDAIDFTKLIHKALRVTMKAHTVPGLGEVLVLPAAELERLRDALTAYLAS